MFSSSPPYFKLKLKCELLYTDYNFSFSYHERSEGMLEVQYEIYNIYMV